MAILKLLVVPVRRFLGFPLVQLAIAIIAILFLQAADSKTMFGQLYNALDVLVDYTVRLCGRIFEVKSFTRSWLTTGFMIAYVYLAGLVLLWLARMAVAGVVEFAARNNAFGLTHAIARERGIAAYQAWVPLERIRPTDIPQEVWEERFAWPADNRPPYPPLWHRTLRAFITYLLVVTVLAVLIQAYTPFPVLTWLGHAIGWAR